jgi:hypothetical protein
MRGPPNHRLEVTAARNGLRRTRMATVGQRLLSRGAHHYTHLGSIDGEVRFYRIDKFVQSLVPLPDGFDSGLAVSSARQEAAQLRQGAYGVAQRRGLDGGTAVILPRIDRLPLARLKDHLTGRLWIGASHHRNSMDAPGNEEIDRDGIEEAMVSR